jgi:putative DNA primase/helicase
VEHIELERVHSALSYLDAGCDRDTWIRIGMAAKAAGLSLADWILWCSSGSSYGGEREAAAVWRSFKKSGIGAASLFKAAIIAGWADSKRQQRRPPATQRAEPRQQPALREMLDPKWLVAWDSLDLIEGAGRDYLEARSCVIPPADGDLRYSACLRHPSGYAGPGLVALITNRSGDAISLHRTWIRSDGTKADVKPSRLLLGGHRKAGGVIRLWPDEAVTTGLGIAEGIETALSLAQAYRPVWALIDAGNLAKFQPMPGVECLMIAVDHDDAGTSAAEECARNWTLAGHEVRMATPPDGGDDLNDFLRGAV